jgi:hypothetical protein
MINSIYTPEIYVGNDTTTEFPFGFKITEPEHIKGTVYDTASGAVVKVLELDTDFTVTGVGEETGGSVTYPLITDPPQDPEPAPLATGQTLVLELNVPLIQDTNFENQGGFFPQTHENLFDKVFQILQKLSDELSRTLKTSVISEENADELLSTIITSAASAASSASSANEDAIAAAASAAAAEAAAGSVTLASQAEAEAGSDNTKYMSALRVKQSIATNVVLASQAEAEAGSDNAKTMTSLRVKQAIVANAPKTLVNAMGNVSGTITPVIDKINTAALTGDVTLTMPTPTTGELHTVVFEFTMSVAKTVTVSGVTWNWGATPSLATGTIKNRMAFDTIDGGTTWKGYYSQF